MKKLLVSMALIVVFALGACSGAVVQANAEEETVEAFSFTHVSDRHSGSTYNVVDNKTGVNYICVEDYSNHGGYGVAITPRFNADGSLYVSEVG